MAGTRLQIVGCFVFYALCIAPFAYQFTQVERQALPVDRIDRLHENAIARGVVQNQRTVSVVMVGAAEQEGRWIWSKDKGVEFYLVAAALEPEQATRVQGATDLQELDDALDTILPRSTAFSFVILCGMHYPFMPPQTIVGKYRHAFRAEEACSGVEGSSEVESTVKDLVQTHWNSEKEDAISSGRRARLSSNYRLEFTLLKEDVDVEWQWDLNTLHQRYLSPFLSKMEPVASFSYETETLYYAGVGHPIRPHPTIENASVVSVETLRHFKSANDYLAASVTEDREQVLHLTAALPTLSHSPLYIDDGSSDKKRAFEIPGHGAVVILDPHKLTTGEKGTEERRLMQLFLTHLRTLLYLPSFATRQRAEQDKYVFLPSPRDGVADWELNVLVQRQMNHLVTDSIQTLTSIVQLVDTLPEMSVLEDVRLKMETAVDFLERALFPHDLCPFERLRSVRMAAEYAQHVHYDHTMIRQLYFPQEQIFGVFAPLLAPLLLPFVVGLVREGKRWRQKRRAKTKQD